MAREGQTVSRNLFAESRFAGFGPSRFHPLGESPGGNLVRARNEKLLHKSVREKAPHNPGVYGMLDNRGRLIYVGKAKDLRNRLMSYFRKESRERKAGKIIQRTRYLLWEHTTDELGAFLRELELIQRFRPRFNVIGIPGRQRYVYICLGRAPASYLYLSRDPSPKDLAAFGPFIGRGFVESAVRRLNDLFQLRNCAVNQPMRFANQPSLFPLEMAAACMRHELGTCLGPCAGACSQNLYTGAVRRVRSFLDGSDGSLLKKLRTEMQTAAQQLQYERAAAIRDKLTDLEWLDLRLALLRKSRDQASYIYPLEASDGRTIWYILNRGQIVGAMTPPTESERGSAVERIKAAIATTVAPTVSRYVDSVLLVSSWFRKRSGEREKLRPTEAVIRELTAGNPTS